MREAYGAILEDQGTEEHRLVAATSFQWSSEDIGVARGFSEVQTCEHSGIWAG